jgi:hypothetical protein
VGLSYSSNREGGNGDITLKGTTSGTWMQENYFKSIIKHVVLWMALAQDRVRLFVKVSTVTVSRYKSYEKVCYG